MLLINGGDVTETVKLRSFSLRQPSLSGMSSHERTFVLTAAHILNELNTLNKLLVWFINTGQSCQGRASKVSVCQAFFIAKIMAGKVNEAWEILGVMYFKNLSRDHTIAIHEDGRAALASLKKYFSKSPNVVRELRNNCSFHYAYESIGGAWEHIHDSEDFVFLFGENVGNSFFLGAELASNFALMVHADSDDFLADVQGVQENFQLFLEATIHAILKKYLRSDPYLSGDVEEVDAGSPLEEHRITFFCRGL